MSNYPHPTSFAMVHTHWCVPGGRLITCHLDPCPWGWDMACGDCPTEQPAVAAELKRRGLTPRDWYREVRQRRRERTNGRED